MFRKNKSSGSISVNKRFSSMVCSSSAYSLRTIDCDKPACGFLNRKTVLENGGKKSKDRTWLMLWCQVKDGKMEFYKINGFNVKPHGEPPPKDIFPPPNRQKQNAGYVFLENSLVELDYLSQEEKDIDKRRRFLFRLILSNKTEYLFQGPSENIMLQWVTHIKRATFSTLDPDLNGPSDLLLVDARIKASRCSINKKSKHNTNSVRVAATVDTPGDEEIDTSLASLVQLDPRLVQLKKRLQNKRELQRQLQRMLSSFAGNTECLYKEAETPSSRLTSRSGSNPPDTDTEKLLHPTRASASSTGSNDGFTKTTTTVLEDYYMLPGVEWSLLKKGETVEVLGKVAGGWYRCRTNKDTSYELDDFITDEDHGTSSDVLSAEERDTLSLTPNLLKESREDNSSLLEQISTSLGKDIHMVDNGETTMDNGGHMVDRGEHMVVNGEHMVDDGKHTVDNGEHTMDNGEHTMDNGEHMVDDGEHTVDDGEDNEDFVEKDGRSTSISLAFDNSVIDQHMRIRTESYMMATTSDPVGTFKRQNLFRKDSYNHATGSGRLLDSIELSHSPRGTSPRPTTPTSPRHTEEYELKRLAINNILAHEKANNRYVFPLVGLIPASVLHNFERQTSSSIRPSSSTSDYGSSGPNMDEVPTGKPPLGYSRDGSHVKDSSYDDTMLTGSLEFTPSQDEGDMFVTSMDNEGVANYPIPDGNKGLKPPRKTSDRSMSLPTSSLFPSDFTPDEVSQRFSPDILEDDKPILSVGDSNHENEHRNVSELKSPVRRNSRKMKVIASPTSTLERSIGSPTDISIKVTDETGKKSPENITKVQTHKRSNSEDMSEKQRKGLLSRIKSNISARKSSPKHQAKSVIPSHLLNNNADEQTPRNRVTSISGKHIRSKGMGITFGESSSESESEEMDEKHMKSSNKSATSSPIHIRKHINVDKEHPDASIPSTPESPVFHSPNTPVDIIKRKAKARIYSDSIQETDKVKPQDSPSNKRRNSFLQDGTHMSGFIQAPPRGVKRSIYLDPDITKFGFKLEKYEMSIEEGKTVSRTIVQHVIPGSPAFVAGFFPGDQIVSVNGQYLENSSVKEVANAFKQADPNRRIEVVVTFVEGGIRMKKKTERGDLQIKLVEKQKNLGELVSIEQEHLRHAKKSPSLKSPIPEYILPKELSPWREDTPPEENSLHVFNYNYNINNILSLHHGDIRLLSCDMLVIPFQRIESKHSLDNVRDVLKAGGDSLMDELSMLDHCEPGNNLYTKGHGLPAKTICHCIFGSQEDSIFRCCRQALKMARQREYETVAFWISGFISTSYTSPHHIICAVRGWLEEGTNCSSFNKMIFSVPSTPAMISLIERYFPLEDYKLQDFLQELNYVISDEDDEANDSVNINSNSNKPLEDTPVEDTPPVPPRSPMPSRKQPTPSTTPTSNEPNRTLDRTKYVKLKFNEIDSIIDNVNSQVATMK